MECTFAQSQQKTLISPTNSMTNPIFSLTKLTLKHRTLFLKPLNSPQFSTVSQLQNPSDVIKSPNGKPSSNLKEKMQIIKQSWLLSLSSNGLEKSRVESEEEEEKCELKWVIGVDPDVSGALAVLKSDFSGVTSAEVFDSPSVQVPIGKKLRKRLDARSIVQLVQSFNAPKGTVAYLEQSIPFPQDGKQGWWSGGFGYGIWIGVLVASGFSVVPVPSSVWKKELEVDQGRTCKDKSRELASELFPNLDSMLKRKKDHGRAEALLIAAYGNGHKIKTDLRLKLDQECRETASGIEINGTEKSLKLSSNDPYESPKRPGKLTKPEIQMSCSVCKSTTHNKRTCPDKHKPLDSPQPAKRGRGRPKSAHNNLSTYENAIEDVSEAALHNMTGQPTRIGINGCIISA